MRSMGHLMISRVLASPAITHKVLYLNTSSSETPKGLANCSPGLALKPWGSKGTFGFVATLKELRRVLWWRAATQPFQGCVFD